MAAAKFKATCLAVLDEVQSKRELVLLTKNGKPVAKLVPIEEEKDPLAAFRFPGHITIIGDIVFPSTPTKRLRSSFNNPSRPSTPTLLDTHVLNWLTQDRDQLSERATQAIIALRESGSLMSRISRSTRSLSGHPAPR